MSDSASLPSRLAQWFDATFVELVREFRWSYLPPLMVYLAAGLSGLTAIVGTFFVKDYLGLSAAFLAALSFWAGIPWTLKMPLGHLVDLIWPRKALLVYAGAVLIAASLGIMYGLIAHTEALTALLPAEAWYVVSALLAPAGYVLQDVVADAMTVEAVPTVDARGEPVPERELKRRHTTMQTLGRLAIIGGSVAVAALNITLFAGVGEMSAAEQAATYATIYQLALAIPLMSVAGVALNQAMLRRRARRLRDAGVPPARIAHLLYRPEEPAELNPWILGGGLLFAALSLGVGLSRLPFAQELVFASALAVVGFLLHRLTRELAPAARRALLGTAVILFAFRAVPLPGPGATWFEIDVLGFDQRFLSVLSLITSLLAMAGMLVLRPLIARRSVAYLVTVLTVAAGVLALPNIGLYYGLQDWTARWSGGVVDARFIAIVDTAVESPLGQIAMIPMLAWIANNAPSRLKATFFAVMASFTNLALSASSLLTKYLNQWYVVSRDVRDPVSGALLTAADYGDLGRLLITVALIGVALPLLTVLLVQRSPLHTDQ